MKKAFAALLALLLAVGFLHSQEAPTVQISTVVATNSIVGVARRVTVDFPDNGTPITSVSYVIRRLNGTSIISERPLEPVTLTWEAITNRYPEVIAVLDRMKTDMASRLVNQTP